MSENQPVQQDTPITEGAIAYYPRLLDLVPTITCAVLVTYLEMRFPTPTAELAGPPYRRTSSLPVTVSAETVCKDLRVSRRTLALSLYAISRVFPSEASRAAAQRAGREFILHHHRRNPTVKLYSLVTDYNLHRFHTLELRRNLNKLALPPHLPAQAHPFPPSPASLFPSAHAPSTQSDGTKTTGAPRMVSSPSSLADILLKASVLSGDRRSVRYPRLRKAVAEGLEAPGVLKAKQPRRKTTLNDGVEPDLPEELTNRLGRTF